MVIVTGANGFIGSALVYDLNQNGVSDILCVDTITPQQRPAPLKHLKYTNFIKTDEFFSYLDQSKDTIECIFHMGACSSTTELDVEYLKKNNTDYTHHLFLYCRDQNIPFIYASSGAVYGDGSMGFSDNTPPETFKPLNPYGWSKLNFDVLALKEKSPPHRWYGLRFFNVYGPNEYHKLNDDMCSIVYKAYLQIQKSKKLKLFRSHHPDYKDGEQMRDFVYIKDITRWMIELWQTPSITSGIYNLGFGEARTWIDLASIIFESLNEELTIDWIDIPDGLRQRYQYFTEANISKLKSQGLSLPQWPIEDGVKDYILNFLNFNERHLYD